MIFSSVLIIRSPRNLQPYFRILTISSWGKDLIQDPHRIIPQFFNQGKSKISKSKKVGLNLSSPHQDAVPLGGIPGKANAYF
jgi:hypothetical protein